MQVEKGKLRNEGGFPELLAPAPAPSAPSSMAVSPLLSALAPQQAAAPASIPAPELPPIPSAERPAPPLQAPGHAVAPEGIMRSSLVAPAPSNAQKALLFAPAPMRAEELQTVMQAPEASGAPESSEQPFLHFMPLGQAASPGQASETLEFCRQLACPHNASASPEAALTAAEVPTQGPEPQLSVVKPPAQNADASASAQAPMRGAALPSQLLSVALSRGQLAEILAANKVEANGTAIMPESAPASAPSPVPGQQPAEAIGQSLAAQIRSGLGGQIGLGPVTEVARSAQLDISPSTESALASNPGTRMPCSLDHTCHKKN